MADRAMLKDVRVGSTLLLPCRLTAKTAAGVTLEAVDESYTATGSFSIAAAGGAVTGAWTSDPREQAVRVVAYAIAVGDSLREIATGVVEVVQAINVDGNPNRWSPSAAGRPSKSTAGWEPYGTFTPPPV